MTRRDVAIVALDPAGEHAAARLARTGWQHARFLAASTHRLPEDLGDADLVVMLAGPGGYADAAATIGRACSDGRVMTTALIVDSEEASNEALSETLVQVRPWSLMVVVGSGEDYVENVLTALRA